MLFNVVNLLQFLKKKYCKSETTIYKIRPCIHIHKGLDQEKNTG